MAEMTRSELRHWLLANVFNLDGRQTRPHWVKKSPIEFGLLEYYTAFFDSPTPGQRVFAFLNGQTKLNTCIVCSKGIQPARRNPEIYCSAICSNRSDRSKDKAEKTCMRLYGVKNGGGSDIAGEKARQTSQDRYGATHAMKTSTFKEKVKKTNIARYGVDCTAQAPKVKDKIRQTILDRYGVTHAHKSPKIIDKIKATCQQRYGVDNAQQRGIPVELGDPDWLYEQHVDNKKSGLSIDRMMGVGDHTTSRRLRSHGIPVTSSMVSAEEDALYGYIASVYDGPIIRQDRSIIRPKEIDLYLPECNMALEYNGVYWHSEKRGRARSYHLDKTEACEAQGIQLLHIFSSDDMSIWESVISAKLGLVRKIGARKTSIRLVGSKESRTFLSANHLQGYVGSTLRLGLYLFDELLCLMTFGKPRFDKSYKWELLRFCTKKDYQVVGGASRLFKHSGVTSCISYANRRWSDGRLYDVLGFDKVRCSAPNYFYTKDHKTLYSRNKFQKHKLAKQLDHFYPNMSEYANMQVNGYDRIWDSGNLVYAYN